MIKSNNKTLLAAVLATALTGFGAAAHAQYTAIVSVAPPAPQYEVVPGARAGYVWDAGHYEYRGNRYVWVPGRWLEARDGYQWEQRRWVQRGNEWQLVGGDWRRGPNGDRDGDGVANRYDRDRDGDGVPNRYDNNRNRMGPNADLDRDGISNRNDRDIDGDGIRNNRDSHPYDRRRG